MTDRPELPADGPSADGLRPHISARDVVYADAYQRIVRVAAEFGSLHKTYFVRESGARVGILVLHEDSVLLTRQYRLLLNGLSWEIPGGKVDDGETPQEAAIRECIEETGVPCTSAEPLLYYLPGLDILDNPTHLFYTRLTERPPTRQHDPDEVDRIEWLPLARCLEMVQTRELVDGLTIAALLAFQALVPR